MSKGWDNATLKKLKALTGKGLSTSEIGKRLGMSKNAIVGKLNRLGWNAKASGANAVSSTTTEKKTAKKAEEKPVAKATTAKKTTVAKAAVTKKVESKKVAAKTAKVAEKKVSEKTPVKKTAVAEKKPKADTGDAKSGTKTTSKTTAKDLAAHQRIIQHSLEMANLKPGQCRWPIGDPDSEHFHFCGEAVFVGKPYCYEHCKQAYQFTPPKKK